MRHAALDQATLDALPDVAVVLDTDGRVVRCGDRAGTAYGIRPGELLEDLLQPLDDRGNRCGLSLPNASAVATRMSEHVLHCQTNGGSGRYVAMYARILDDGYLVLLRSAARRMHERRDAAKTVDGVAHDIRSPLTSVKGFTATLVRRWDRFDDERKQVMLATIEHDAERVAQLLSRLLEVARLDAGVMTLRRQPVDVGELTQQAVKNALAALAASEKDAAADRISVVVLGEQSTVADEIRLTAAVRELVENALSYAPVGPVEVSVMREGEAHVIRVRDEGPGIPNDLRTRLFDKFGRGTDVRRAGTGLGLYVARGITRAHGGDVVLVDQNEDGSSVGGATFALHIPHAELDF